MKGNAGDRVPSELRTCKATVVPGAIRFPVFFPIKDVVGFWGSGRSTVLVKRERTYFEPAYRSMSATNCLQPPAQEICRGAQTSMFHLQNSCEFIAINYPS